MMKFTKPAWICWFIFFPHFTISHLENKTSSECLACNTSHALTCSPGNVIVIQKAEYGYKGSCMKGINGGSCSSMIERKRCCSPAPFRGIVCYKPFNNTDKENLMKRCSSKSTCLFNSIIHDELHTCRQTPFNKNSFTQINYTCQNYTEPSSTTEQNGHSIFSSLTSYVTLSTTLETVSSSQDARNSTTTNSSDQDETNGGTTAAIVICVLLLIAGGVVVLFFYIRKRRRQKGKPENTSPNEKSDNATNVNTTNTTSSPIYHIVATDSSLPSNPTYELANDVKNSSNQSQTRFQSVSTDNYNQIDDTAFIQNQPHSDFATGEDDYHHIGGDNSSRKVPPAFDTYNHVNPADMQLDKDDYHHIDVNTTQETVNEEYNHIGPDCETDNYGYNRFGDIKPEVNDHDNYNHIDRVH